MKKALLLSALLLLAFPLLAHAQDSWDAEAGDGYLVTLPAGWELDEATEGATRFANGDMTLIVIVPPVVAERAALDDGSDPSSVLQATYEAFELSFDADKVKTATMQGVAIAYVEFEQDARRGLTLAFETLDGEFAVIELETPTADYPRYRLVGFDAAVSFRKDDGSARRTLEPCEVRAVGPDVPLHLGPSEQRAVFRRMEPDVFVPVLFQSRDTQDNAWWRLDTDTGAASELWVSSSQVETRGDCAHVQTVDASHPTAPRPPAPAAPVVPPSGAPPAPQPAGMVQCPIVNETVFTVKGNMSGPGGVAYYFEVAAGGRIVLSVVRGDYNVHFFCDGCGNAGNTGVWPCDGNTEIHVVW